MQISSFLECNFSPFFLLLDPVSAQRGTHLTGLGHPSWPERHGERAEHVA